MSSSPLSLGEAFVFIHPKALQKLALHAELQAQTAPASAMCPFEYLEVFSSKCIQNKTHARSSELLFLLLLLFLGTRIYLRAFAFAVSSD